MIKICTNCGQEKEHHAKGLCYACYKKLKWSPENALCKRCGRQKVIHAKGLCAPCYNYVFHREKSKEQYHRRANNIDIRTYRQITKECILCGFNKIVDIHHLDGNKENNDRKNLIGLCPNHHRLLQNLKFRDEILKELEQKKIFIESLHKNPTSTDNLKPL